MNDKEHEAAIKNFVENWKGKGYEKGEAQKFWLALMRDVLQIPKPEHLVDFEYKVPLAGGLGFIDALLKNSPVLIEQKSSLVSLMAPDSKTGLNAFQQAKRYNDFLEDERKARWIVTCNFNEFYVYHLRKPEKEPIKFTLRELPKKAYLLDFMIDEHLHDRRVEEELSAEASLRVGKLHSALRTQCREPNSLETLHALNILCVRLVFLLYADCNNAFRKHDSFRAWLDKIPFKSIHRELENLFEVLNTPKNLRDDRNEDLNEFPYVDGGLFEDKIQIPTFTSDIKQLFFKELAFFEWQEISPTIFGTVFESTIDPAPDSEKNIRREGGMHYTSPENILRVIKPLFLDDLTAAFVAAKKIPEPAARKKSLLALQDKISAIKIFDPACGSGNFLTESYRQLRKLENSILKEILGVQIQLGAFFDPIKVSIENFYGVEINDFAAKVAQTALWISEIQMRKETAEIIHQDLEDFPLKTKAHVHVANSLTVDWSEIVPRAQLTYIISNPPFVGYSNQTKSQKEDLLKIYSDENGKPYRKAGKIDYVAAWYFKASKFIQGTFIRCAFVSTNSITQGEQVADVWQILFERFKIHFDFAYRTFKWRSKSDNMAHVHVVIIGFSAAPNPKPPRFCTAKILKEGKLDDIKLEVTYTVAQNINAYLIDGDDIFVEARPTPLCDVPRMNKGSQPTDNGNLIIEAEDYKNFIKREPAAKKFIRPLLGAEEFINGKERWCLWLVGVEPETIKRMPLVYKRVKAVREFRLSSRKAATRESAKTPTLFQEIRQPSTNYILVPRVSGESRIYVPIDFVDSKVIATDAVHVIPCATVYLFGVLTSIVHMAWMRVVAGYLGTSYRYSATVVYNNFPFPSPSPKQKAAIELTAQKILDVRAKHSSSSFAALYDKNLMPPDLRKAHAENDAAVLKAYNFAQDLTEAEIVAQLFKMYQALV